MITVDQKPLVIVLSRNYSTGLGLIRSLGQAGFEVDLVASARRKNSSVIASSSKYTGHSVEFLTPMIYGDEGRDITDYLMEQGPKDRRTKVLFPADDYTASVVDLNRDLLKEYYLMPEVSGGERGTLTRMMSKDVQGEFAREAGLERPYEIAIYLGDDFDIPSDLPYPCFIKPLKSVDGEKTEMAVAGSFEELVAILNGMKAQFRDRSVLVQEFLNIEKEYDVGGVCLGDEVIIPGVIEKTHLAEHERGVTMAGRMISKEILGDALPKLENMLKTIGLKGMFDLEFNLSGGRLYFNEINFRSGGPHYFYYLNGVNLPELFVKSLCGMDITEDNREIKEFGKTFVYEKVAWEDHINGFLTKKELKEVIDSADFTLLANVDDPAPAKIFARKIRLSLIKQRILKGLKRKHHGR
ncbi:MAG: hypothetical protein II918_04950 [Firmicutes bacterium]|nr:hypothetical protein [Bacillota bacterium]